MVRIFGRGITLVNLISELEVALILAFHCHHVIGWWMASGVCHTKLWCALDSKKVCTAVMVELAKRVHMITVRHMSRVPLTT